MNISCDMAIDLISLYMDGAASEDTKKTIREHLKSCKSCAHIYAQYSHDVNNNRKAKSYLNPTKSVERKYSLLAENLHKKHITDTISMASVLTISVGVGIYCLMKMVSHDNM